MCETHLLSCVLPWRLQVNSLLENMLGAEQRMKRGLGLSSREDEDARRIRCDIMSSIRKRRDKEFRQLARAERVCMLRDPNQRRRY